MLEKVSTSYELDESGMYLALECDSDATSISVRRYDASHEVYPCALGCGKGCDLCGPKAKFAKLKKIKKSRKCLHFIE